MRELADIAREVITGGRYMSLGTADAAGYPRVSPVFYTEVGEHSVLIRGGDPTYGRGADSRMTVTLGGR